MDLKELEEYCEDLDAQLTRVQRVLYTRFPGCFDTDEVSKNGDKETTSSTSEGAGEVKEEPSSEKTS